MFSISKKGAGAVVAFAVVLGGIALAPAQAAPKVTKTKATLSTDM